MVSLTNRYPYGAQCPDCHGLGAIATVTVTVGETLCSVCPHCDGAGRRGIVADSPAAASTSVDLEVDRTLLEAGELRRDWPALDALERSRRLFNLMFQLDSLARRLPK